MKRQREVVVDYLAKALAVPEGLIFHACLLPEQLLSDEGHDSLDYPVVTWQGLHAKFSEGRHEDYWLGVLRAAIDSYDSLASRGLIFGANSDDRLAGRQIYDGAKAGTFKFPVMGRNLGYSVTPSAKTSSRGGWTTQRYEVSESHEPPNRNWFRVSDFVALVDAIKNGG